MIGRKLGSKKQVILLYGNFPALNGYNFCAAVCGKDNNLTRKRQCGDHTGERNRTQRDVCGGEHQGTVGEQALGPEIATGEGAPLVPLDIAQVVVEVIWRSIHVKLTGDLVAHAEHPVPALQKGNKAKWSHDIVRKRRGGPEAELSLHMTVVRMKMEIDALRRKSVLLQSGLRTAPADKTALAGEGNVPMLLLIVPRQRQSILWDAPGFLAVKQGGL